MHQLEAGSYCIYPGDIYRSLPEDHWSSTKNSPDNPSLVLAQVLEQKGVDIQLVDSETPEGDIEIHASPEGETALNRIICTPELRGLIKAWGSCDPTSLTPDGIRELIGEVVERELALTSKS